MTQHPVPQWVYFAAVSIVVGLGATSVEIYSRQQLHDVRIVKLEDRVSDIDRDGSRQVVALAARLEAIQSDLVAMRVEIAKCYDQVGKHNEEMLHLYDPKSVKDRRTLDR